ncbi:hypothetical protein [Ornithinimicrobium sp. W1665]
MLAYQDALPVLAQQHDGWAERRRYIGLDALVRCRTALTTATAPAKPPRR